MPGAKQLRDSFNEAANGAAQCSVATLHNAQDDGAEVQILTFRGRKPDGAPFEVSSGPLKGGVDVFLEAARVAREFVAPPALPPPTEG